MTTTTTRPVTFPEPLVTYQQLREHILTFLRNNPQGVRNSEVARAIGYYDTRMWFSFGVLERMQRDGLVRKNERSRYFLA